MEKPLLFTDLDHKEVEASTSHAQPGASIAHGHSYRREAAVCIVLHIAPVVLHVVLLCVWARHYEHGVIFAFSTFSANWLPAIITSVMQTIGVAYLAVLVMVTQKLALRADLRKVQTLTAIHDKNTAWLGLGSAVWSAWQQFKLRSAALGVACISTYLIGIFVLHITIPSMLHVETSNDTIPLKVSTILAKDPSNRTITRLGYDILPVYGQFPTLGLLGNMVYDAIQLVPGVVGNTTVNASIFNVECAALPDAIQIPFSSWPAGFEELDGNYLFQLDSFNTTVTVAPPYFPAVWTSAGSSLNVTKAEPECHPSDGTGCWLPIIVSSTVPIVDSLGSPPSNQPWTAITPQAVQQSVTFNVSSGVFGDVVIPAIQVVSCALSINYIDIVVSAQNGLPVSYPEPPSSSLWTNWTWPTDIPALAGDPNVIANQAEPSTSGPSTHLGGTNGVFLLNNTRVTEQVSAPLHILSDSVEYGILSNITSNFSFTSIAPTTFDEFLCEDLGLVLGNTTQIALADVDLSLGRALAASYWYSLNSDASSRYTAVVTKEQTGKTPQAVVQARGEATVTMPILRTRLNLTLTPIVVGLIAAVALLLLSAVLIRLPSLWQHRSAKDDAAAALDATGTLQLTWLFGSEPALVKVREPRMHALRQAGMYPVNMGEMARHKGVTSGDAGRYKDSVAMMEIASRQSGVERL